MKRYIKADDSFTFNPDSDIMIEIDVILYQYVRIAAAMSTIKKIRFNDKTIDEQGLADYNSFVKWMLMMLETSGFAKLEGHDSTESLTSHYYVYTTQSQKDSGSIRRLLFLRISDHIGTPTDYQKKKHEEDRKEVVDRYLCKRWIEEEVIVNGERFSSYDDAEDFVSKKIPNWLRKLGG